MKLARSPRRTPPESIIPLIDVVFFLLVFFMLIGRMDATAPFDVTPAIATAGADMPGGGKTVSVSRDGALALDGQAVGGDDLRVRIAAALDENPNMLVRINAHARAPLADVLPLVAAIESLGARDVVLVVTPPAP